MLTALRLIVLVGLAASLVPVFAQNTRASEPSRRAAPRFEDFRVPTPIPPRNGAAFVTNHVPDPEKEISESAKEGPDFAGHFVIERFSCGSGCTSFVIVNVVTLKVFRNDFDVAYSFCPANRPPGAEAELAYKLDSRLLIVTGAIETLSRTRGEVDGPCGYFYYLWDGRSLKQIHSVVPAAQPVRR
jgi:hypothetical protein